MSARQKLRSAVLSTVGTGESALGLRALERPATHFLYLHSLREDREANFRSFLTALTSKMTFVSYSEAVERVVSGGSQEPAFCISVDDAFSSNMRIASITEEFGGTSCFFVPTGLIGAQTRHELAKFFRTTSHIEDSAITWTELEDLAARGHEIGSHTVTHPNIAEISDSQLENELWASKVLLDERIGDTAHFAWPYGTERHSRPGLAQFASEAGYQSTASAIRGAHLARIDPTHDYLLRSNCDPDWPSSHSLAFICRAARAL